MLNLYTAPPKERLRREDPVIETPRLLLRPWRPSDLPIFAEQNADPEVIQFLGGVLNREESDAYVARADRHLADRGFCKWAVEAPGIAPFVGAVGLTRVRFDASFTPAVVDLVGLAARDRRGVKRGEVAVRPGRTRRGWSAGLGR